MNLKFKLDESLKIRKILDARKNRPQWPWLTIVKINSNADTKRRLFLGSSLLVTLHVISDGHLLSSNVSKFDSGQEVLGQ